MKEENWKHQEERKSYESEQKHECKENGSLLVRMKNGVNMLENSFNLREMKVHVHIKICM